MIRIVNILRVTPIMMRIVDILKVTSEAAPPFNARVRQTVLSKAVMTSELDRPPSDLIDPDGSPLIELSVDLRAVLAPA